MKMNDILVKSIAKLFAESYKPYNFGAFGKPTLQRVEQALAARQLIYSCNGSNTAITAAAIFKVLSANSYHTDFSGRRCQLTRGSLYVEDLGVSPDYVIEAVTPLVNRLSALAPGSPFWIEIHEENKALRELVERRLGFHYVMTKIMASSDIKGLYVRSQVVELPKLKACEIPSFVRLVPDFLSSNELDASLLELREYASRRKVPWVQHYSLYNKRHSWTALALRGYCRNDPDFIGKPTVMSKHWKATHPELLTAPCRNTTVARYFGITMGAVDRIPGQKERVRFMRLAARQGELSRHADVTRRDVSTPHVSVIRLHIPLVTHPDVFFESWGLRGEHKQMHFEAGGLYYFDNRKPHRVINRSPVDRIHLVVDVYASTEFEALLRL